MKKLFTIREKGTGKLYYVNGVLLTFSNKTEAKQHRDTLNSTHNKVYIVSLGPDHKRYKWEGSVASDGT